MSKMHFSDDPYAGFHSETLSNGLSVFTKEVDAPWIYVGFVVHVGAREDPYGRDGLAHLVEHLVSENVDGFTFATLETRFQALGGSGQFGEVGYLSSSYHFCIPDDENVLDEALSLFGQMLVTATLARGIKQEKAVITREYHLHYPFDQQRQWTLIGKQALFEHHRRLPRFDTPLGTPADFLDATEQEVQTFYDRYYTPANISVVSIGRIAPHKMVDALSRSPFGWQKPGWCTALPSPFTLMPPSTHELVISMADFSTLPLSQTDCTYEWALPMTYDPYQVWIGKDVLETILMERLRYERSLTYDVSVESEYYQDCRLLSIELEVAPETIGEVQETIWRVLRTVHEAEQTFHEVKRKVLNSLRRPDYSGSRLLRAAMKDLQYYQRLFPLEEEIRQLERVTFEDMIKLAAYFTPERHFHWIIQP
jgi:predicted Zn-dependent peptidase